MLSQAMSHPATCHIITGHVTPYDLSYYHRPPRGLSSYHILCDTPQHVLMYRPCDTLQQELFSR